MIAMSDDGERGVSALRADVSALWGGPSVDHGHVRLNYLHEFVRRVTDDPESLFLPSLIFNLPLHPTHPKRKRQYVVEAPVLAALREEAVREAGGADADDGEEVD